MQTVKPVVVIDKSNGSRRIVEGGQEILVDRPSVVMLQLAPERIARYERRGDDLVLVLKDGQEITIQDFFVKYPVESAAEADGSAQTDGAVEDGRTELVLEDDYGVVWWGQYPEEWSEFYFTEIELTPVPGAVWWPWALGALGGVAAIAGASSGGGGSDAPPENRPPQASADSAEGQEDAPVSGNVLTNDSDPDGDSLSVTGFTIAGDPTPHAPGASVVLPGVGTFTLAADGAYTFTPAADWNGVVPTVTYTVSDGEGGSDTAELVITVDPVNDGPTPVGAIANQADADAATVVDLDVTTAFADVDDGSLTYSATGLPDGLTIDPATGVISGTIDRSASQDGAGGVHSVIITATDAAGASTTQTFDWTVTNPAPTAGDDATTTDEDVPVSGNVLTNDSDPDGDGLTVTTFTVAGDAAVRNAGDSVVLAGVGTFTLAADGAYTFTPAADWNGVVPTVTYTVSDGEGGSDTAELVITVDPDVDLTAIDDSATTTEDTSVSGTVAGNDATTSGGELTFAKATDPGHGTVTVNPDGTYLYTPGANYNGPDSFTYTVTDPTSGETLIRTVTITVDPVDDLTAGNDSTSTTEDTPVSGTVAGNDATTSGGTLTFVKATDPDHGTVIVNPDGTYTYTPDANYNGPDSFTYTVTDPTSGETLTRTVDIIVDPVNDGPTPVGAIADQANTDAEAIVDLDVTTAFADVDDGSLTYSASGLPDGLVIDPATGVISGVIDRSASQDGTSGVHTVTVTATDGSGATTTQTFDWTVTNPAPTAGDDAATTDEDVPVSGNVLTNDGDPDGDSLSVTGFTIAGDPTPHAPGASVAVPGVGTFTLGSDGAYTFTPAADWNGVVPTVTYTVSDGEGGSDTAELAITVDPVNDGPTPVGAIANQADADAETIVDLDVATAFADVDDGSLTYSATGLSDGLTIDPATGVISGTIDRSASQDGVGGVHSVIITATDAAGASTTQTFDWTVTNPAPTAGDDAATTDEDIPVSGNVLTNDSDPDGDGLTVTTFTVAGDAAVRNAGDSVVLAGVGTFTLAADGAYTFTPAADWNGVVPTVTYTVSDGEGGSDTAELVITVDPVNDAPTPVGSIADQADADAEAIFDLDVTTAFADVDDGSLTYSATGLPDGLTIDPATGVISGVIDRSASQDGAGGVHSVIITATDAAGASTTQTFDWTVTNPAPTAGDDAATTDEEVPVSGNVLTNDSDPDGDSLTVTTFTIAGDPTPHAPGASVVLPGVGTFTLAADGAYTFTPAADWNGVVPTVTYTVSDGEGGSDTAELVITVDPVNDAPVISGGSQTGDVSEAGALDDGTPVPGTPSVSGSFSASDVDNGVLNWSVVGGSDATYGAFGLNASTGEWTYTLNNTLPATQALVEGETVDLTYTVQVSDGVGGTETRTVTVTITGANDTPTAAIDAGSVTEQGVAAGGNTPAPGVASATGNVLPNDADVDAGETATLEVSAVRFGAAPGAVGSPLTGVYGQLELAVDGSYVYTLDNTDPETQALASGTTVTEVFTYEVVDANGATSTSTLTITITGANDQPIITSSAADAQGSVVEAGTGIAGTATDSGVLTASDVDAGASQTWSIASVNGVYGTIAIDPATGQWTYTLDNTRPATQALNSGDAVTETFTARVTDEVGGYSEQVITVSVAGSNDDVEGTTPAATVPLAEDATEATGTLQDYVSDVDDVIEVTGFQVDADGDGVDESFAPGDTVVLTDDNGVPRGSLTIEANGDYSFIPAPQYSGAVPTITYTMAETGGGSGTLTQTLTLDIAPVSDAPLLEANKTVNMVEDVPGALGLQTPVITDTGAGVANGDLTERLGEITLTLGGAGATGATLSTGGLVLTPVGGQIVIVLTDVDHIAGVPAADAANGVFHLTSAQYEALVVNAPAESGRDLTVSVSVTSFEVDGAGTPLAGVPGALSSQLINVDVQAATDGAALTIDGGPSASVTSPEDAAIDLTGRLAAALGDSDGAAGGDADGSETYWYVVSGLPVGTVVTINGVATTITASVTTAVSATSTTATPPTLTVRPPANYSGDIEDVTITLNSRDTDTDSAGVINTVSSSVTLDLHVTPVAGDARAGNVTTAEDTAVAFLSGVTVTDGGGAGTEVIDEVAFTVPAGWVVTPPPASAGWTYDLTGSDATVTFDASLTEAQREAILDAFLIEPPAHSSEDVTISLSITTTDTNTVDGTPVSDIRTVSRDATVTVTPVAERADTDSDGAGGSDVTLLGDRTYAAPGEEDAWFALGNTYTGASNPGGGQDLMTGWGDADADEFVYAVLTPTLTSDTPSDQVVGTQFRYSTDGGTTWTTQTYTGEPIWVPQAYLDTLQVKLPPNVAGTLTVGVQAGTVDYDDDADVFTLPLNPPKVDGPGVNVEISGSATLSQIVFNPAADAVTMALNGRAAGLEDTSIPLDIRTTSSDASETFNVTIDGIPAGSTVVYDGVTLTVTNGSVTIPDFDNAAPLAITPPPNSSGDFPLTVTAVSVDGSSTSAPVSRTIDVSVTGVADAAVVTLPGIAFTTTEAALDAGGRQVALGDLVTGVASPDGDGSEATTLRITGVPEGVSVTGATMVASGSGAERIWVVSADDLANVSLVLPPNYSGTVTFRVAGVTTENDGDSRTASPVDVSFTVTPSPEALTTTSAVLVEDQVSALGLALVQQNGDADETLGEVYIAVDYATGADYALYLAQTPLEDANLDVVTIGGVDYFVIPAGQASSLGAMGASDLDGDLGTLDFLYERIDPSNDGTLAAVTEITAGSLALTATPVTDIVDASITGLVLTTATGSTADNDPADDAAPDTAVITGSGAVTVTLNVASADIDGSEHLVRVLITGVPDGVTVTGAAQIGAGSWLLVYEAGDAQAIGAGGVDVPVEFIVGRGAGDGLSTITMTVQAQDQGQSAATPATIQTDAVSWNLDVDLADGEPFTPPTIDQWDYNGAAGVEDTGFALGDVMDAAVSGDPAQAYSYTVTLTDLPPGTTVEGMILTTIGGEPTWTATITAPAGADSQALLEALLAGIIVTPPTDSNDNTADFAFDARLTASTVGGPSVVADATADMPVVPVTDAAVVTVTADDVGEGADSLSATIDVDVSADGAFGQVVDGKLYVRVETVNNGGGALTDGDGSPVGLTTVTGVPGVPDGDYYVVDVPVGGGQVELTYTAADGTTLAPGSVTFTAYAQTQESGAGGPATGSGSDAAAVQIINNGVAVSSQPVTGAEAATADKSNAIELTGLSAALVDGDGSESIRSILLSGVPVGFLLYVGTSAGDATLASQASNAGGDGSTNTWVLSEDGDLPAYVAILPAPNWSGALDDLSLVVESGEATLLETRVDVVPLETVTVEAVANGLALEPTLSFGAEGQIIDLNLNASMVDAVQASAAVADQSRETTTLQITGLGAFAAFYVGNEVITVVAYDPLTDTYTLTGLSQDQLDDLAFVQAADALTDQDGATAGVQVTVTAWTVESGNGAVSAPVTESLTVAVSPALATTGADCFIWDDQAIDGRGGTDTVALRRGETLDHAELSARLSNIEIVDLSAPGQNSLTGGLSIADVLTITGSTTGRLVIEGDEEDAVELASGEWTTDGAVTDGHVVYTNTSSAVTLSIDEDIQVSYAA